MKENGQEEKRIAVEKGNMLNGIPFITVIGDGGWAKRSYGHGMNSSSGVVRQNKEQFRIFSYFVILLLVCKIATGPRKKPDEVFIYVLIIIQLFHKL